MGMRTTLETECSQCGVTVRSTHTSDGQYPSIPEILMWKVSFTPPEEPNIAVLTLMCEPCAIKLGGTHLAEALKKTTEPLRRKR